MIAGKTEDSVPRILIADDDRGTRFILRKTLEAEGYHVIEAEDGFSALQLYETESPDMVLLDAMMPGIDGFTLCGRIRNEFPERKQVPILMITSLEDGKMVDLAYEMGVTDFIAKPIHWEVFKRRIRNLLDVKKSESLIEKYKSDVQSIINRVVEGIVTLDSSNQICSFNQAAEKIFGYTPAEIIGVAVDRLIPDFSSIVRNAFMQPSSSDKKNVHMVQKTSGVKKDGTVFPVEFTLDGIFDGERLLTIYDLTEKKRFENKLSMAVKVFENITEAILVLNSKGDIEMVNPAFTRITKYAESEVLGKSVVILRSEIHDFKFYQEMMGSLRATSTWSGETWITTKDGANYPVNVYVSAILDDLGKVVQHVAVFHSIVEQIKLRAKQEMLQMQASQIQKVALLSTLSAGIIHELNQPLNSIKILTDGMLYVSSHGQVLKMDKIIENLKKISAQIVRAGDIIQHMRAFISDKHGSEISKCNLNHSITKSLDILRAQLTFHGIVVKKSLMDNLPEVPGNVNILEEVVINLVVNAMHALDESGKPEKEIVCRTYFEQKRVILEVADNGIGIREEIKDRIFEPLFSTKTSSGGMGLGLSLVKSILSNYNGSIEVFNNENGGATFRVCLPLVDGDSVRKDLIEGEGSQEQAVKIL